MIRRPHAAALLAAAVCFAPASFAVTADDALRVLEKSDRNGDGRVTRAEHYALRITIFERLDANGDGRVDQRDAPSSLLPRGERFLQFKAFLDSNGDGVAYRAEAAKGRSPLFDRADRNRDGVVDQREMAALRVTARRGVD